VFISTCSFIQLFFDPLNPVTGFGRRTENKIKGQKTCSIRPSESQQLKTFDTFPAVMIKNLGQQFDDFRPGAIVGTINNDKDFFSFIICQLVEKIDYFNNQDQHKLTPIVTGIFQQFISCVFFKWQCLVFDDALKKNCCPQKAAERLPETKQAARRPSIS
jgi:hypothetical protein